MQESAPGTKTANVKIQDRARMRPARAFLFCSGDYLALRGKGLAFPARSGRYAFILD